MKAYLKRKASCPMNWALLVIGAWAAALRQQLDVGMAGLLIGAACFVAILLPESD